MHMNALNYIRIIILIAINNLLVNKMMMVEFKYDVMSPKCVICDKTLFFPVLNLVLFKKKRVQDSPSTWCA